MEKRHTKKFYDVHGDDVVNMRMVQRCFTQFSNGNFNLSDEKRSGRFAEIDNDQISALIQIHAIQSERLPRN